jgi:hypothetical protein
MQAAGKLFQASCGLIGTEVWLRGMSFSQWFNRVALLGLAVGLTFPSGLQAQTRASSSNQASSNQPSSNQPSSNHSVSSQFSSSQTPAILPQQFGGWQIQGGAKTSSAPQAADPTNADVLAEYRFSDYAGATYTRDDGRTLKIRAARFADASGAFGAYTFYLQPEMAKEEIGDQGASVMSGPGQRVLFYRGQVLVDALFSQPSAMSAAELRELAGALPLQAGGAATLPSVLLYMPQRGYVRNSQKYAEGSAALAALAPPVSADLVDFGASAEVTLGHYDTPSGEATLMLISYPTPQLATEHLRRIDAAHQLAPPQPGVSAINCAGAFCDKRTGPIVAIVTGAASDSDAKSLLRAVNYEASVTWNQPTDNHDVHDLYMLVVNVVILCAIVGGLAIVAGVAFGGFRIVMKRWFPDKVFDRPEQMEFISLRLAETIIVEVPSQNGPKDDPRAPQNPA